MGGSSRVRVISTKGGTPGRQIGLQPGETRTSIREARPVTPTARRTVQRTSTRVAVGQAPPRQLPSRVLTATKTPVSQVRPPSPQLQASVFGRGVARPTTRAGAFTPTPQQRLATAPLTPQQQTERFIRSKEIEIERPKTLAERTVAGFEKAERRTTSRITRLGLIESREVAEVKLKERRLERAKAPGFIQTFIEPRLSESARLRSAEFRARLETRRKEVERLDIEAAQFVREKPLRIAGVAAAGGIVAGIGAGAGALAGVGGIVGVGGKILAASFATTASVTGGLFIASGTRKIIEAPGRKARAKAQIEFGFDIAAFAAGAKLTGRAFRGFKPTKQPARPKVDEFGRFKPGQAPKPTARELSQAPPPVRAAATIKRVKAISPAKRTPIQKAELRTATTLLRESQIVPLERVTPFKGKKGQAPLSLFVQRDIPKALLPRRPIVRRPTPGRKAAKVPRVPREPLVERGLSFTAEKIPRGKSLVERPSELVRIDKLVSTKAPLTIFRPPSRGGARPPAIIKPGKIVEPGKAPIVVIEPTPIVPREPTPPRLREPTPPTVIEPFPLVPRPDRPLEIIRRRPPARRTEGKLRPFKPGAIIPFIPLFPTLDFGGGGFGFGRTRGAVRKKGFIPSLIAIELGITTRDPSVAKRLFTGFEVRPIITTKPIPIKKKKKRKR